jgi:autotransporter passenger strand-loop-strand repeat protein
MTDSGDLRGAPCCGGALHKLGFQYDYSSAIDTTIDSSGVQYDYGATLDTTISNGGIQYVESGFIASQQPLASRCRAVPGSVDRPASLLSN